MKVQVWRKAERGIALLVSVAAIAVMLGFLGLAVDTGHLLETRSRLQSAADMAALAASGSRGEAGAKEFATLNGFPKARVSVTLAGDRAEVQLSADAPVLFLRALGRDVVEARARAVARAGALVE